MDNQKPSIRKSIGKVGKSIIGVGKGVGRVGLTVIDRLTRPIELNILPRSSSKAAFHNNKLKDDPYTVRNRRSPSGGKKGGKKTKRNMRKRGTQKRR
jgi:hypothetical protein